MVGWFHTKYFLLDKSARRSHLPAPVELESPKSLQHPPPRKHLVLAVQIGHLYSNPSIPQPDLTCNIFLLNSDPCRTAGPYNRWCRNHTSTQHTRAKKKFLARRGSSSSLGCHVTDKWVQAMLLINGSNVLPKPWWDRLSHDGELGVEHRRHYFFLINPLIYAMNFVKEIILELATGSYCKGALIVQYTW